MTEDIKRVGDAHRWLIRPALMAAIALTIHGNLSSAQPSVGGWLSHGWAPVLYLVAVEVLVRRAVGGRWLWPVVVGLIGLALVAGVVSFTSLTRAAERWGWSPGEAWMYPVTVDIAAVLFTMASVGASVRVRELRSAEQPNTPEPVRRVRKAPEQAPNTEPNVRQAPEQRTERPAENKWVERILAEFGDRPRDDWPNMSSMAEQFGCSKSTLSNPYKRAEQLASELGATPRETPVNPSGAG